MIQENGEDLLLAGDWMWFGALAQDNFNYRDQEGYKQIRYDNRIWTCQGAINSPDMKKIDSGWAEDELECRFVLVRNESPRSGYVYGKSVLLYTAAFKVLQLDDDL